MKIIYRISDTGYNKVKPNYIDNEKCLSNFYKAFSKHTKDITVIADNVSENTYDMIKKYVDHSNIIRVSIGHGAGTFNLALTEALKYEEDEVVYFVENDYVHRQESDEVLLEGFSIGSDYVALYDHPDKDEQDLWPIRDSPHEEIGRLTSEKLRKTKNRGTRPIETPTDNDCK